MIRAFAVVGGDIGAPTIITGGVSEALVATATGLTVAIIALGFHSYCAAKVNDSITTLEHEWQHPSMRTTRNMIYETTHIRG